MLTISVFAICGCGSPGNTAASIVSVPPSVTGNWELAGTPVAGSTTLPAPIAAFFGSLSSTGTMVTGIMRVLPALANPCVAITQDLPVTGTISNSNLLILTIPIAGGTATLSAQLGTTLQTSTPATYTVSGGTCAMAATAGNMSQFAPVTGTYTGTLSQAVPATGPVINVSATLVQSSMPNADGLFPLSGSVVVSGTCVTTFTFADGTVTGNNVNNFYALTSPLPSGILRGATTPTAATLQASLALYVPGCLNTFFNGPLTRQ